MAKAVMKEKNESKFVSLAKQVCNGCDLITGEENKLTTGDVLEKEELTIEDFAMCTIDEKEVGVVTFVEFPGKYYWGGQALSNMVKSFCAACGSEEDARIDYANESQKVRVKFETTTTRNKQTFTKVTVL